MNKTVLRLPRRRRVSPSYRKPRRRVLYLGYRCIGPMFCQDIQRVYLKRHRDDEWSFLYYEEGYSFEFDNFKVTNSGKVLEQYGAQCRACGLKIIAPSVL